MASCPGGLILHGDGSIAGCTHDDDPDGCAGRDLRHEDAPRRCVDEREACSYCGAVEGL
jgi:hypothetical protein